MWDGHPLSCRGQNGQQKAPGHCDKAGRGQAVGVPGCTCVCHQLVLLFLSASGLGCQLLNLLPTDVPAAHSQGSLSKIVAKVAPYCPERWPSISGNERNVKLLTMG